MVCSSQRSPTSLRPVFKHRSDQSADDRQEQVHLEGHYAVNLRIESVNAPVHFVIEVIDSAGELSPDVVDLRPDAVYFVA